MTWAELFARPRPAAQVRIAYGPLPQQFGELWVPTVPRAPLVVMIHGGCWTKSVASLSIMNWAAEDLRRSGLAVLNLEYRGVDEDGGGYPGTYSDIASGLDGARGIALSRGLSFETPVVVGHSAGGHLALWAAARRRLPQTSPLWRADPQPIAAAVVLAGIADLEADLETACGAAPPALMAGVSSPGRTDPYADTSPAALLPLGVPQILIYGSDDEVVRKEIGLRYRDKARAAGDTVAWLSPPGDHVAAVAPGAAVWASAASALKSLVAP